MATAAEFLDQQDADEFLDAEDDAPETPESPEAPDAPDAPDAPEAPEPAEPEDKPAALDGMLSEFGAALDEIANALHEGKRSSRDIGDTLAQLLEVIRAKDGAGSLAAMTKAIKGLRAVTVNVSPTPVTIEAPAVQVIERAKPGEYEMRFTYDDQDRIESARLVPVEPMPPKPEPGPRVIWPAE